jgi:hypothetical protein
MVDCSYLYISAKLQLTFFYPLLSHEKSLNTLKMHIQLIFAEKISNFATQSEETGHSVPQPRKNKAETCSSLTAEHSSFCA